MFSANFLASSVLIVSTCTVGSVDGSPSSVGFYIFVVVVVPAVPAPVAVLMMAMVEDDQLLHDCLFLLSSDQAFANEMSHCIW